MQASIVRQLLSHVWRAGELCTELTKKIGSFDGILLAQNEIRQFVHNLIYI